MNLLDHAISVVCGLLLTCFVVVLVLSCTDEPMRPLSSLDMIQADQRCKQIGLEVQFEYRDGKAASYSCVRAQ